MEFVLVCVCESWCLPAGAFKIIGECVDAFASSGHRASGRTIERNLCALPSSSPKLPISVLKLGRLVGKFGLFSNSKGNVCTQ